jgi:hypothetical protein
VPRFTVPMTIRRRRLAILAGLLVAAAAFVPTAGSGTRDTVQPTLYVEYTMNCTFAIVDDFGRRVTSIAPGSYQLHVATPVVFAGVDLSGTDDFTACKSFVQFQLSGPGVSLFTTLQDGDEDKDDYALTFLPSSSYTAQDLVRGAPTRTVFTTTATGSPAAPASPYTPSSSATKPTQSVDIVGSALKSNPLRGTITATIDAAGKPTLAYKGKALGTLRGGRYTTTVTDQSKKAGLVFQLLGKSGQPVKSVTASATAFVGKHTTTVTLQKGQWIFTASSGAKKTYFVVVG